MFEETPKPLTQKQTNGKVGSASGSSIPNCKPSNHVPTSCLTKTKDFLSLDNTAPDPVWNKRVLQKKTYKWINWDQTPKLTVRWDLSESGERTIGEMSSWTPELIWLIKSSKHLASESPASDLKDSISEA